MARSVILLVLGVACLAGAWWSSSSSKEAAEKEFADVPAAKDESQYEIPGDAEPADDGDADDADDAMGGDDDDDEDDDDNDRADDDDDDDDDEPTRVPAVKELRRRLLSGRRPLRTDEDMKTTEKITLNTPDTGKPKGDAEPEPRRRRERRPPMDPDSPEFKERSRLMKERRAADEKRAPR